MNNSKRAFSLFMSLLFVMTSVLSVGLIDNNLLTANAVSTSPIKTVTISVASSTIRINEKQKITIKGTHEDNTSLTTTEIANLPIQSIIGGANSTGITLDGQYVVGVAAGANQEVSTLAINATLNGATVTSNTLNITVVSKIPYRYFPSINATAWYEPGVDTNGNEIPVCCCRPGTHEHFPNIHHVKGEKDCPFNIAANLEGLGKGLSGNALAIYVEQYCDGTWFQDKIGQWVTQAQGKYVLPKRENGYVLEPVNYDLPSNGGYYNSPYKGIYDSTDEGLDFPKYTTSPDAFLSNTDFYFGSITHSATSICDSIRMKDGTHNYNTTVDYNYDLNLGLRSGANISTDQSQAAYGLNVLETRVIIDLKEVSEVTKIDCLPNPKMAGKSITYYYSNDAKNWTQLANITANEGEYLSNQQSTDIIPSVKFRYLRVVAKDGLNSYKDSIPCCPSINDVLVTAKMWIDPNDTTWQPFIAKYKAPLNSKISESDAKDQTKYTAASWTAFANALTSAKAVSTNLYANQSEAENANTNLTKYMTALVLKPDATNLNALITECDVLLPDQSKYTPDSWTAFTNALTTAKTVSAKAVTETTTQTEIDTALNSLNTTKSALALKPLFKLGDPNADAKIDGKDIAAIVMHITKVKQLTNNDTYAALNAADVNKDSKVDGKDIAAIVMHITKVKLITG